MKQVIYKCEDCGAEFEATQYSRVRYCDKCLVEHIKHKHYLQGKCELCGKEGNVVRHHWTYNMFNGQPVKKGQLCIVCLSCHRKIHVRYPKKSKINHP